MAEGQSTSLLTGFTALDLSGNEGQFAGRLLADLGMRVIKVEPPNGDAVRCIGPFKDDLVGRDKSLRFAFLDGGKESITLNLETADGQAMFLDLVPHFDAVIESFRPGYLDELDLGYSRLRERNRRLVLASITPFGQDGPRANYLATDIVGVAMGGIMFISGDPSLPPVRPPETQSFYYASIYAAYAVLLALFHRGADGDGQHIDLSIQESVASQEHMIREAAFDGVQITRNGSQHKHTSPANIFPCTDGHVYLFILGARDWERLLELWTDHPVQLDDPALKAPGRRRAQAAMINPLVEQFTARYSKRELMSYLQGHGIPCLPVNSPRDFLNEEQVRVRDFFGDIESADLGRYQSPRFPALFNGQRPPVAGPPPHIGADNAAVYGEWLGLGAEELELLAARGVV
jgi:crotonobetainyl-CoA:carnitine CoA-transferase CaiB-like acyl-CoA transferase